MAIGQKIQITLPRSVLTKLEELVNKNGYSRSMTVAIAIENLYDKEVSNQSEK